MDKTKSIIAVSDQYEPDRYELASSIVARNSQSCNSKEGWRVHPLDGALLFFQPSTGMHIRWDAAETRSLKRTAPRIVMFGITNRCNLSCNFCYRDLHAGSQWDVESAFEMLAGLSRQGVLEVAFGGGEPLAFRGFDELISRLGQETPLALHFTTNGTLLTSERLMRLKDWLGEIRLSIYDDNPWPARVEMLVEAGVRFGVNLLVTPARLAVLPALLNRLATLGCCDVALLSYVGDDTKLHLSAEDEEQLAAIIAESPIRARLSVCFGDRLQPLPRLFDGDCGAGVDFVVLTSDKKVKSCSFQRNGIEVETADDLIRVWRASRDDLSPAGLLGCARPGLPAASLSDGIRVWQSFSGNNSGDCVLVGRFQKAADAQKFIADLLPDFQPGEPYAKRWQELLARAGISVSEYEIAPAAMAVAGRTILLNSYSAEDDFPSLRALLWRRGGRAIYSAIHEHDDVMLVVGFGCRDEQSLELLEVELDLQELGDFRRRGLNLFGIVKRNEAISDLIARLEKIAAAHNGLIAAELASIKGSIDLAAILAARPTDDEIERLWVRFTTEEAAIKFADKLQGNFQQVNRYVIVEGKRISPRMGYFAQHHDGVAEVISGRSICLVTNFWNRNSSLDEHEVAAELLPLIRPYLSHQDQLQFETQWNSITGKIDTANPYEALVVLVNFAKRHDFVIWVEAQSRNKLADAIARISHDLKTGPAERKSS